MIKKIYVSDHQGEQFEAELEIYRVMMTGHLHMRISRGNHITRMVKGKDKISKRDHVHIIVNADVIREILQGLGENL